jgi:hypothetical protein
MKYLSTAKGSCAGPVPTTHGEALPAAPVEPLVTSAPPLPVVLLLLEEPPAPPEPVAAAVVIAALVEVEVEACEPPPVAVPDVVAVVAALALPPPAALVPVPAEPVPPLVSYAEQPIQEIANSPTTEQRRTLLPCRFIVGSS